MSRQSISFTPPNNDWLRAQVETEEFASKSEVVNDLIRRARQQDNELEEIRAKLIRAEQSGFTDKSPSEILASFKAKVAEK